MNRLHPSFVRVLLLLIVAVGPLQARTVFACAMMDTVVHDACCCDHHRAHDDCLEPGCDPAPTPGGAACCEPSVEISVDQQAGEHTIIAKPAEVRSDVDPPHALFSSFDALSPPHPFPARRVVDRLPPAGGQSGSATWLITQRLRI